MSLLTFSDALLLSSYKSWQKQWWMIQYTYNSSILKNIKLINIMDKLWKRNTFVIYIFLRIAKFHVLMMNFFKIDITKIIQGHTARPQSLQVKSQCKCLQIFDIFSIKWKVVYNCKNQFTLYRKNFKSKKAI